MGPVQHRLGPGHRPRYLVPLQLPRPLRWIPVCLWYASSAEPTNTSAVCSPKSYSEKSSGTTATFRFNLGGRINLLYCFFWGIAAVVWLKKFYPVISRWIEKIPMKFGKIITWILIVFMVANMLVSTLALARYDERAHQKPAANAIEQTIDAHFPDARMEKIYPNAKAIN